VISWVESSGKAGAKGQLAEIEKGAAEIRPFFLYFYTNEPKVADGKKDYAAMKTCEKVNEELKVRALANLLREYVCIRVNVAKADAKVLETHGVREAPTALVLDIQGNLAALHVGAFGWGDIDLDLQDCLENAETKVRELAGGDEKAPKTVTAKKRLAGIQIRELYAKGEKLFQRARWEKAAETFKKVAAEGKEGNFFKKRVPSMLAEIQAAKLYFEAIEDLRAARKKEAREKLEKIVYEMENSQWFRRFAKATLGKL
jgi:predicted Zn-dependent protease